MVRVIVTTPHYVCDHFFIHWNVMPPFKSPSNFKYMLFFFGLMLVLGSMPFEINIQSRFPIVVIASCDPNISTWSKLTTHNNGALNLLVHPLLVITSPHSSLVHPTLTLLVMKFLPLHHYRSTKKRK
jgi:hypothetical protein